MLHITNARIDHLGFRSLIFDGMLAYRLYFLGRLGHLTGVKEINALGDAEARERAILLGNSRRWELWHGAKLIARSEDHCGTQC